MTVSRSLLVTSLALVLVGAALATSSRASVAVNPSTFARINNPLGIAVTSDRVLVTQWNKDFVRSLDSAGNVTTFATLPSTGNASLERYIAVSPGLGGFPAGFVYVTVGQNTYEITPDGSSVTLFVNISSMPNGETGITFDTVGTFGFKMILTDRRGPVWTVDSNSKATKVADVRRQIEGPEVAPPTFVPFAGQIIVGNEFGDAIFAVKNDGTFKKIGTWESAEGGIRIPSPTCNFGTSGGAYFVALQDQGRVVKFPASDFTGFGDDILTPSELNDPSLFIGRWHSNGSSVSSSTFSPPNSRYHPQLEGSAFAPC